MEPVIEQTMVFGIAVADYAVNFGSPRVFVFQELHRRQIVGCVRIMAMTPQLAADRAVPDRDDEILRRLACIDSRPSIAVDPDWRKRRPMAVVNKRVRSVPESAANRATVTIARHFHDEMGG
jgi:hypothetical protein